MNSSIGELVFENPKRFRHLLYEGNNFIANEIPNPNIAIDIKLSNVLYLDDESISPLHAMLAVSYRQSTVNGSEIVELVIAVTDLNSSHGTFVSTSTQTGDNPTVTSTFEQVPALARISMVYITSNSMLKFGNIVCQFIPSVSTRNISLHSVNMNTSTRRIHFNESVNDELAQPVSELRCDNLWNEETQPLPGNFHMYANLGDEESEDEKSDTLYNINLPETAFVDKPNNLPAPVDDIAEQDCESVASDGTLVDEDLMAATAYSNCKTSAVLAPSIGRSAISTALTTVLTTSRRNEDRLTTTTTTQLDHSDKDTEEDPDADSVRNGSDSDSVDLMATVDPFDGEQQASDLVTNDNDNDNDNDNNYNLDHEHEDYPNNGRASLISSPQNQNESYQSTLEQVDVNYNNCSNCSNSSSSSSSATAGVAEVPVSVTTETIPAEVTGQTYPQDELPELERTLQPEHEIETSEPALLDLVSTFAANSHILTELPTGHRGDKVPIPIVTENAVTSDASNIDAMREELPALQSEDVFEELKRQDNLIESVTSATAAPLQQVQVPEQEQKESMQQEHSDEEIEPEMEESTLLDILVTSARIEYSPTQDTIESICAANSATSATASKPSSSRKRKASEKSHEDNHDASDVNTVDNEGMQSPHTNKRRRGAQKSPVVAVEPDAAMNGENASQQYSIASSRCRKQEVTNVTVTVTDSDRDMEKILLMSSGIAKADLPASFSDKSASKIGLTLTTDPKQATHILVPGLKRTPNLMIALNSGVKHILNKSWFEDCIKAGKVLSAESSKYQVQDPTEKQWGCNVQALLRDRRKKATTCISGSGTVSVGPSRVFHGYAFYITEDFCGNKAPDAAEMAAIITSGGGEIIKSLPKSKEDGKSVVIISNQEYVNRNKSGAGKKVSKEWSQVLQALDGKVAVSSVCYNLDFLLTAVMRQEVDLSIGQLS